MSRKETGRNYKAKGGGGMKPPSTRDLKLSDQNSLDTYLEEHHLQRKPTAKDGSCLFRAVAEQVYMTQFHHQKVRMQCVGYIKAHQEEFQNFVLVPFNEYLEQLSRELWGGELELVVISKLYARTILVFMRNECGGGISEKTFGPAKSDNPIRLAYSDGNHYDSVYSTQHMQGMAVCQGIVYQLLFEGVFQDRIPLTCKKRLETLSEEDMTTIRKQDSKRGTPLHNLSTHYSIDSLRALGSLMYHNAALQIYHTERENIERFDREVASSIQFQIGDKCQFKLPGSNMQEGEICALNISADCHRVFVFDVNEEWEIPIKDISLKHPYTTNGKRNSQPNHQNRSRNRHGNTHTEDTYNRHDNRPPLKPLPPSSNPEAWPPPTSTSSRTQPTKSPATDSGALPPLGMTKSNVNTQTVPADKKGEPNPWPQKAPVPSRPKQGTSPKGTPSQTQPPKSTPPLSKNPHTPNAVSHNTGTSVSKAAQQTSLRKPPGLSKPVSQQPDNRPAKVNGGPGGSLTSEDSNYSGNSSSDESTGPGETTKQAFSPQPPSQSSSDKQSQQHPGQTNHHEGGSSHAIPTQKGVWPGGPADVTAQGRVAPPLVAATLSRPPLNGFPDEQQGSETPYLTPQIPRDPSSQPEDDWPAINPADSRMLSFMAPRGMSPLNIPMDPALTAVTTASFNPMQFAAFGPLPPAMFFTDATKGSRGVPPAQSTPFPESNRFSGSPGVQERPAKLSNTKQGNQTYVVHRTPSSNSSAGKAQPHSDLQKSVSSPNIRSPSFSNPVSRQISHKERSPEPPEVVPAMHPRVAANLQPPRPKLVPNSTQTVPPPETTDTGTQIESLGVTTYTQTPDKTLVDVGVGTRVLTSSAGVQASPVMKNHRAQTSTKVILPMELEPPSLEEEAGPVDKIKFGLQYAIQCLELYVDKRDSEDERVDKVLEDLKEFKESGLSRYLEHPPLVPLDSSQQAFLHSFAASQLQQLSPLVENGFFNRSNSEGSPPTADQREAMNNLLRQQEMFRQGHNGSPRGETSGSATSLHAKEGLEHPPPHHPHNFPPHPLPMSGVPPLMMQRPPFMMMPFYPFGGFPMPPLPLIPPQMIPPNMVDPQSPHPTTPHTPMDPESDEREQSATDTVESRPKQDDGMGYSHQESGKVENSSLPRGTHLVAPSAFTVPSSAYEQPSTVVSAEVTAQADLGALQSSGAPAQSSSVTSPREKPSESPPLTPFETKNPYDSVVVESDNRPATTSKPQDTASPKGQASVEVDESQNLPNRKGKQQPSQQQQRSQRQRAARQPRNPPAQQQHSSKQLQNPPTGAAKSGRSEGGSHKEAAASKEPTDGADKESNRTNPRGGYKPRHSYQKTKGATGNRSGGGQSRQQRQQGGSSSGGGNPNHSLPGRSFHRRERQQDSSSQASGGSGQGRRQESSAQASGGGGQGRKQESSAQASGGGGQGRKQESSTQASGGGQGRKQESSSQASGGGGQGRRQESSTQVSGRSGHGGQDSTRSTFHMENSDKQNVPCTVFHPRAFRGGFPSPSHLASSFDGDYAHPQPVTNLSSQRWKFASSKEESNKPPFKLNRDLLKWDNEDPWPDLNPEEDLRVEGSQTVEDPFPSFPSSLHHWDSDAGDLNVSLTVDPLTNLEGGGNRFPPPAPVSSARTSAYSAVNTHAQCVSESKVSSKVDSECVVGN